MGEKAGEECLVVPRQYLFGQDNERAFEGYRSSNDWGNHFLGSSLLESAVSKHGEFKQRERVENDLHYLQIIPCAIFLHGGRIFTYSHLSDSGEQQLVATNIVIPGHIHSSDYKPRLNDTLKNSLSRKLGEEIVSPEWYELGNPIAYVHASADPLRKAQLGVVFRVDAKSSNFQMREPNRMRGDLLSVEEIERLDPPLMDWDKSLFEAYKRGELDR